MLLRAWQCGAKSPTPRAFAAFAHKGGLHSERGAKRPAPGVTEEGLLEQCEWAGLRKGGPGGQRRNKAETGVRLEHVPTGVRVEAHDERTQKRNKELAVKRLRKEIAVAVREDIHSWADMDASMTEALARVVERKVGPKNEKFADGIGPLLDLLEALNGAVGDVANELGTSTGNLSKVVSSDKDLLEAVNRIRKHNGFKPLRASK